MSSIFGEILTFQQEKGNEVKLVVFGDEYYARYETEDGYSAIYDSNLGLYCYAFIFKGEFVSSSVPISKSPPSGIRRHLKESEEVRNAKFNQRYNVMLPPPPRVSLRDDMKTFGANKGLLPGRKVNIGKIKGLTVLINFNDVKSTVSAKDVSAMLNDNNYTANGNFCSVREYFRLMSNNKLDYSNVVVGPITLKRNRYYYTNNLLVKEALDAVVETGIDLSQFDSQHEGIIDAINFMYAGQTVYEGDLWPHNSYIRLRYDQYKTYFYQLTSLGRNSADLSIGTFCHENGHMLCRFPDLYDYGTRDGDFEKSAGLGTYCLMSAGNHLNKGRTPSPICGYLRDIAMWCDNRIVINTPGKYEAKHGDYETVMIFQTDRMNEYYIVENRSKVGIDQYLPSSGLAVYHCDTLGSNEWQGGTSTRHYQCGLLQADGHFDLEHNINMGDEKDLFSNVVGIALSRSTKPSSRKWDSSDSGLIISDISDPGNSISFKTI